MLKMLDPNFESMESNFIDGGFGFENDEEARQESILKREKRCSNKQLWMKLRGANKIVIPTNMAEALGTEPAALVLSLIEKDFQQDPRNIHGFFTIPSYDSNWTRSHCPCNEKEYLNSIELLEEMEIISTDTNQDGYPIVKINYSVLDNHI